MFKFTAHRAILDYHRRPRTRATYGVGGGDESGEARPAPLPGAIGMTRHRITFELNRRLADNLLAICDEARADETISEAKLDAINTTREQLIKALAEYEAKDG